MIEEYVSVRYIVNDVQKAIDFYAAHPGFKVNTAPRRRSPT